MNLTKLALGILIASMSVSAEGMMAPNPATAATTATGTAVTSQPWGKTKDGKAVEQYTLTSADARVSIITYGARISALDVADRNGKRDNIVLGYKDIAGYEADKSYFGSIPGRFANRIAKGKYTVDGKNYEAPVNNGVNSLHGGTVGFAQKVWTAAKIPNGVEMTLVSPSGDMGYPGKLTVHARYVLSGNELRLDITATTDADTVLNLTNHSYFNLSGEGNGTITHDLVQINADKYLPVDDTQIPTGELAAVAGTPFDFREPHTVGDRIDAKGNHQLELGGGYDHTWVLRGPAGSLHEAAAVLDPQTGRLLKVATTQPGVQFYTGNSLTGTTQGSNGKTIERRGGLCLETHHFPDSPNQPAFPTTLLKPGQTYHETTLYTFQTVK